MHQYQYLAKQRNGSSVSGAIEAVSLAEARMRLRERGLFVVKLAVQGQAGAQQSLAWIARRKRIARADVLMFTTQLSIMCRSGLDLADALDGLASQCRNPAFKAVLSEVYRDVTQGNTVADALRNHPQAFDESYVAAIAAGEQSGSLEKVLGQLTALLRNDIRLRKSLWSVMVYPIVLASVSLIVVMAMIFFVLPQFAKVFEGLGEPAPPLTQLLLDAGSFTREHGGLLLGMMAGLILVLRRFSRTTLWQSFWDTMALSTAPLSGAVQPLLTGRSFRLIGTMLSTGVPLLEAIQLAQRSIRNTLVRELFSRLENDVINGRGIHTTLAATAFVPAGAAQMVATAERTGQLAPVLESIGEYYQDEGERRLHELAKILEPAIIVAMGAVVAVIVLAIVLPLLDVSTASM